MSADREPESDPPPKRGGFPVVLVAFFAGALAGMLTCGGIGTVVVAVQMERARAAEVAAHQAEMQARWEVESKEQAMKAKVQAMKAAEQNLEVSRRGNRVLGEVLDGMARVKEPQPRSLFINLVNGATQERLTDMLGKPNPTELRDGETCWVYVGRTINPETEKPDRKAVVRFRDGKVADVTFE